MFVSATSRDLGTARRAVFDALTTLGIQGVEQTHFPPDHRTIREILRANIAGCDAVVHVAGRVYGGEPDPTHGEPRRSYTQLEVEIADSLDKPVPVYVFLTADGFPFDDHPPESDELVQLQRDHHARLRERKQKWEEVSTVHHLLYRVAVTPFPGLVWFVDERKPRNLPFAALGSLFKGRDEFLAILWKALGAGGNQAAAVVAKQAIHGLGGVGKTRAAVEYAYRFADQYRALLFITADSPQSLTSNLAGLCGPMVLNLPEQDDPNLTRQAAAAVRWLETNRDWFLIFDNVDTPDAANEVKSLLPRLSAGHVVITSRLSNWKVGVAPLEMDVLDEGPGAEFLLERTADERKPLPTDAADALALARDLDGLALALEQAGAFVARHRCSLADYRARWRSQEAKVVEWDKELLTNVPRSVAKTWQTSIDAMGGDGRGLMNVLAWLAPEPVPLTMLAKLDTPEGATAIDVEAALADLAEYSFVKWDAEKTAVIAHRLVLEVTRYRMPSADRRAWLQRSLAMMDEFVVGDPDDVRTWKLVYDPARDHTVAVVTHADLAGIAEPTSRLMNQMGFYFKCRAWHAEAEPLYQRALAIGEATYGPDHPTVAAVLNNLAELLLATNRHAEAEPLYRRALAINEHSYGPDHPAVATPLNNLARLLETTNRLAEAEPLYRRALAIREASYGPDHPAVAAILNNLAELLRATNRLAEAEPLYRRALAINEHSYGPDHPAVATVLNNLALLLQTTSRPAGAERLYRRALAINEHSYGPDHPAVARALNNLALLLRATNRPAEAEPLYRRALAIGEASYGPDHPTVAAALNNLAGLLRATHRLAEAEPLYRRALAIGEASYGPDHPTVAIRLNDLAGLLRVTSRLAEAEPLYRRALAIDEASYGPDHPDVARDLNNLAQLLGTTNRPTGAEPLFARSIQIWFRFQKLTGHQHPNWEIAINNYVRFLMSALCMSREQADARVREVLGLDPSA